jgi:hypothetical protein
MAGMLVAIYHAFMRLKVYYAEVSDTRNRAEQLKPPSKVKVRVLTGNFAISQETGKADPATVQIRLCGVCA